MAGRRFEFVEGSSSKFWEIALERETHTVCYGRIGGNGSSKTKHFASEGAARADAEKLVREKLGKGYVEVASALRAAPPPRSPPKAKGSVAPVGSGASPGVRATLDPPRGLPRLVLLLSGAELSTNGVPETHASAAEGRRAFDRIVRERTKLGYRLGAVEIVADAPPEGEEEHVEPGDAPSAQAPSVERAADGDLIVTFHGDIPLDVETCRALVSELRAQAPGALHLVCDVVSPGAAWAEALVGVALPSVRTLVFDTPFLTQARQKDHSVGDLSATLAALPSLESLSATGALELSPCRHTKLRELALLGDPLSAELVDGLARSSFPALEQLELSLASDAEPVEDGLACGALLALAAPSLSRVHLWGVEDVARALHLLVTSPRTEAWTELAVEGTLDEDAALEVIKRHRARLARFARIALPLGDYLSSEGEARLREVCPALCDTSEIDAQPPLASGPAGAQAPRE